MGIRLTLLLVLIVAIVTLTFNKKSDQALAVTTPRGYSTPTQIHQKSWEENTAMPEVDALKAPLSTQAAASVQPASESKEVAQATTDSKDNRGIERRRRHHRRHHRRRY